MPILQWLNRDKHIRTTEQVPYRLLEQQDEYSFGDASTSNMLIQGDNLDALKALLPYYAGRVKCIFIDPPYNTRSAFEHYDDNLEHSQWLGMMYPRLELLRDLLAEDGSIWVTIDDNEAHYLKVIMDEVFGRKNFVVNVVWQKRVSPANDAKYFSSDHDYVVVYAKNRESWSPNRLPRTEQQNAYYKNPDNDPRGPWNSVTYTGNKTRTERPNLYYGIKKPVTGETIWPPETLTWRYGMDKHLQNEANNLLYWGKNGTSKVPRFKMFLKDAEAIVPRSVWSASDCGSTQTSMTEQKKLFSNAFGTPKPELLLQRILHIATLPGDFVLDSFLGSGTTAAIAHKMGRRYIGIEMGDHAVTHCVTRLKKVIEGEQGGISEAVGWKGGGGFRFYQLGSAVFDGEGRINPQIHFAHLAAHIWFSETRTALRSEALNPYLGTYNGTAYYLLYNGILGDKRPNGGNVLTSKVLSYLSSHDGPKVIYGETSRLGKARLNALNIIFKQTPYDVKVG
ncbi:site-specific DNA-methyltransferase [Desulfosporosinus metallidurans]|uniref:Type III restriction-modification system methylation subunit n=1 Tax=Desulfosporosinus metallidurans TaxID=1888891 RepID=A0A1Q8QNR6_9FIRM|nr:site-specific DNA-methyltransferase [Desulfosporosinus metallidurans]OLN28966.1 Type III restriction-modification system methylation subunit [Desulfosporosinus metallidurans]